MNARPAAAAGRPAAEPDALRQAVAVLRDAARPRRIILFGSYARGEQTRDSDVDVMMVAADLADVNHERVRLRSLVSRFDPPIEVVTVDGPTFDYWRDTPGNVYYEATHGGRELYRAAGESEGGRQPVVRSREQAAMYLRLAQRDAALLEVVVARPEVDDAIFGFHAQQAAEKLLKAVMAAYRIRVGKQHDIEKLMEHAGEKGLSVPPEFAALTELSPFAVDGRYVELGAALDRQALLERIVALRQWAEGAIAAAPESSPHGA